MLPRSRGSSVSPLIREVAARPCVRLRVTSVACPGSACWHGHSADVRRTLCVRTSDVIRFFTLGFVCFQRKDVCHTVNLHSHPLVATAPPARPPPRGRQDRARPRVQGSLSSGPPRSMQNSWAPTDRDSTWESYVSNSLLYIK